MSTGTAKSFSAFCPAQNSTWSRSRNLCFNGSPWPANTFSAFWPSKMRLGRSRESDVSNGRVVLRNNIVFRPSQNATWVRSKKGSFKGSTGASKSFYAFCTSQYTTWGKSKELHFNWLTGHEISFSVFGPAENESWVMFGKRYI